MSEAPAAPRPKTKAAPPAIDASSPSLAGTVADAALIALFLGLTFLLGIFPLKDTDFWWHLRTGDRIRELGEIPHADIYTYGAAGHAWVDLHWGFQVLLSWGFAHGGVVGLNLAKCAITVVAVFLLVSSRRKGWPVWAVVLAWLPALEVLSGRMYIRPETISLLYLTMVLAILFRWERQPWLAWLLPVVQVGWVNTQGLFVYEPILITFALLNAAARPGAFAKERRGWWRTALLASILSGLACLVNPYGLTGALYPLELARTMGNPIFHRTIGELMPIPLFIEKSGFTSLPLFFHLGVIALGALSFLIPLLWSGWTALRDPRVPTAVEAKPKKSKSKKQPAEPASRGWSLSPFRLLLFGSFSLLSLAATRNSHQFAAVVGALTAWNFAEWVAATRARRLRLDPTFRPSDRIGRTVAAVALVLALVAVGSGKFYEWSKEGRTIGLGEEPFWFPHEATKFAGGPGMPDRNVGFHNGHPSLYEYYWGPEKKTYTDARLEVMGVDLYTDYIGLQKRIASNTPGWAKELEDQGNPSVVVDNVDPLNADLSATLLGSRGYRCVWFDPIASVFVHESSTQAVRDHAVDFLARHFAHQADAAPDDPATFKAYIRALRGVATQMIRFPGSGDAQRRALILLGLDYVRRLREVDPTNLDGWKQAGLLESLRDPLPGEAAIPRFRMPFDPTIDLTLIRASSFLNHGLEIAPDDGLSLLTLAQLDLARGLDEAALPLYARYLDLTSVNESQRNARVIATDRIAELSRKLGQAPSLRWDNLGELETLVDRLLAAGRAGTAADLIERHFRPGSIPWSWAERLATIRLHLGQPVLARKAIEGANATAPPALRAARLAVASLAEADLESARRHYREALTIDPTLFEAHYGLALLEQDAGDADAALREARLAEKSASTRNTQEAARQIAARVAPYVARKAEAR